MKKDHSKTLSSNDSEKIKNKGQDYCITVKKDEKIEFTGQMAGQAAGQATGRTPGTPEEDK